MEKEKLLKPSELAIIAAIFLLIILISVGFYFSFVKKIKEKFYLLREEIKASRQRTSLTVTPTFTTSPSCIVDQSTTWTFYQDCKYGFQLEYPKNWILEGFDDSDSDNTLHLFSEQGKDETITESGQRKYATIFIEIFYLEGGREKSSSYPVYENCLPAVDSFISPNTSLKDRLFCRCRRYIDSATELPFIETKDKIKEFTINGLKTVACGWTFFDILIRDNVLMQISFFRPETTENVYCFDSTFNRILYSLRKIE